MPCWRAWKTRIIRPGATCPALRQCRVFAEQQPERFGATWVAFPGGLPPAATYTVPVVLVVNLLEGDVDQACRDLEPLYTERCASALGRVTRSKLREAQHAAGQDGGDTSGS